MHKGKRLNRYSSAGRNATMRRGLLSKARKSCFHYPQFWPYNSYSIRSILSPPQTLQHISPLAPHQVPNLLMLCFLSSIEMCSQERLLKIYVYSTVNNHSQCYSNGYYNGDKACSQRNKSLTVKP